MNSKNTSILQFNRISLSFGNKVILDGISGTIKKGDKIGLVGINGSGKSTLLDILSFTKQPKSGNVISSGSVSYVCQLVEGKYYFDTPLYKYIGKFVEDWWSVLNKYEKFFCKKFEIDEQVKNLSGGEIIKLNIVIALEQKSSLILFDEPTNHLDLISLNKLQNILNNLNIPFIIVSHNINFLNNVVNTIWELENGNINFYGGNYDFYKKQKNRNERSRFNNIEVLKKKIKKEKLILQKAKIKNQKENSKFKKASQKNDRSVPRITRGERKMNSEKGYGSKVVKQNNSILDFSKKLKTLEKEGKKKIFLDLKNQDKSGLIFNIKKASLVTPLKKTLIQDIDFKIYHGDRLAILGDNASGKTTFINQFAYKKGTLLQGEVKYGNPYKTLFVDQNYDLVDFDLSLLDNIYKVNADINYENARKILGNMGFVEEFEINKSAKSLSGGEIARLAFAMVGAFQIDLLVLDEPTNNLDIETMDLISKSIENFSGTLVIVSHDIYFLKKVKIKDYYKITYNSFIKAKDGIRTRDLLLGKQTF